jgi:hypothetical protein
MPTDHDVTGIVRSWLGTDEHESAERVLNDVLLRLDSTRQRRSWWPTWKYDDMTTIPKLAIAAATVVVLAVVGINLLPAVGGVGGPAVTPSPSPSPTPTSSATPGPSPTPEAIVIPPGGPLAIGRHDFRLNNVPFSLGLATGDWTSNGSFGIDKGVADTGDLLPDGAGFIFWNDPPIGVFADPCAGAKSPPAGSSADLTAAVAAIPGTDLVSGPTDVTVGGHPAKHVVITIREDIGCPPTSFFLWYGAAPGNERFASDTDSTISVWAIDVDGSIVWIDGETYAGAGPAPGQEIQQIIDSIVFE